jgi:hypothetical protein
MKKHSRDLKHESWLVWEALEEVVGGLEGDAEDLWLDLEAAMASATG